MQQIIQLVVYKYFIAENSKKNATFTLWQIARKV